MRNIFQFLISKGVAAAFGLGLLITILFLVFVMGGIDDFNALGKEDQYTSGIFDFGLRAAIGLTVLCAIAMLLFGIMQIASDFKGSLKGIIGFIAILAIFFIAKSIAGADTGYLAEVVDKFNITDAQSGLISGAITTSLAMLGLAVLSLVLTSIRNFFN